MWKEFPLIIKHSGIRDDVKDWILCTFISMCDSMFVHYFIFFLLSTAGQILLDYKQMYSSRPETLKVSIFYLFYGFFCNLSKFIYYLFISHLLSHLCLFWLKLRKQTVLMPLVMVMSSLQPLGVTKAALMTSLDSRLSVFADFNQIVISTGRLKLCY